MKREEIIKLIMDINVAKFDSNKTLLSRNGAEKLLMMLESRDIIDGKCLLLKKQNKLLSDACYTATRVLINEYSEPLRSVFWACNDAIIRAKELK